MIFQRWTNFTIALWLTSNLATATWHDIKVWLDSVSSMTWWRVGCRLASRCMSCGVIQVASENLAVVLVFASVIPCEVALIWRPF